MDDAPGLPPDLILVQRLRDGDEQAFAQVMDTWSRGMLRLARSFVSTNASAEEVVQETWLAVVKAIDDFEGSSSLKTWVHRIVVNTAKALGTKERRTIPFTSMLPKGDELTPIPSWFCATDERFAGLWTVAQQSSTWRLPEDHAVGRETSEVITKALNDLPPRLRAVVALRDVAGYGSDEVCSLLEISQGNQRVLLHRARTALRSKLNAYLTGTTSW